MSNRGSRGMNVAGRELRPLHFTRVFVRKRSGPQIGPSDPSEPDPDVPKSLM